MRARGQLQQQPFQIVGGPDADALALGEAEAQQAPGQAVGFGSQLGVAQAPALGQGGHRRTLRVLVSDQRQLLGDAAPEQGRFAAAVAIAPHGASPVSTWAQ